MTSFNAFSNPGAAEVTAITAHQPQTLAELDALRDAVRRAPRVRTSSRKPALLALVKREPQSQPEPWSNARHRAAA